MLYMDLLVFFIAMLAYKALDRRLFFFFVHVLVGILVVIISDYTAAQGNNVYMSYLFAPFEVIVISAALFPPRSRKRHRQVVWALIIFCLMINPLEGIWLQDGFSRYNSITYVLVNSLLGGLGVYHMTYLRYSAPVANLATVPTFWMALGVAVYHIGLFLVWSFMRFAQDNSMTLLWQLTLVREVVVYLTLILWIIGFWMARKSLYRTETTLH